MWRTFLDLDRTRQYGMNANATQYSEIESYCRLHKLALETWEIRALSKMDTAALVAKSRKPGGTGKEKEPENLVSKSNGEGVSGLMKNLMGKVRGK